MAITRTGKMMWLYVSRENFKSCIIIFHFAKIDDSSRVRMLVWYRVVDVHYLEFVKWRVKLNQATMLKKRE